MTRNSATTLRRTRVFAAGAAALAIGGIGGVDEARSASPGKNGAIAYTSSGGVPSEGYGTVALSLWAMNPDGSAQQAIHQNFVGDPVEGGPVWSPDGRLVAYTRCAGQLFGCDASREVWIRNADGSNSRRVTTGTQPSWIPDGKSLVVTDKFVFPVGEPADQLYRVNIDGSGKTLLTEPDSCGKSSPRVSPLGDRVAFQWGCPYLDKPSGIYAIPIGGGPPVRLTSGTDYERYSGFDWSPDGRRIVYSRAPNGWPVPTLDLFVVELSSGVATRVTATDATGPDFPPDETGPVFSPDGSKIAYHRQGDIWVMNADGSAQRKVTTAAWNEDLPSWQPCVAGVTTACVLAPKPPASPKPACSDGSDNDADGKTDYPADPGCASAADADETDARSDPPGARPACSDDVDNDADGKVDHPADPGCASADDSSETDAVRGGGTQRASARLLVKHYSTSPARPRAGRLFAVRIRFTNQNGSKTVPAAVVCRAALGSTSLRPVATAVQRGAASCTWRLPAKARGKRITGSIRIRTGDASLTRAFSMKIR